MSREEGKTVVVFPDKTFEQYFQQLDAHVKGGNVPESHRAELYGFYGDLLIQRGRFAEAEAAFCQAVKEKPADAKGGAYFTRAQQFLDALNKHGA
jgi:Flp pilus assembly protein TadD